MKACICLLVLLMTSVSSSAYAGEPWLLFDGQHWFMPKLRNLAHKRCWCPDDYDRKTLPTVPCNAKGCGDDYCRKAFPEVPHNAKGCGDDYCRKNYPLLLGNLCEPWYRCGHVENGTRSCPQVSHSGME
jgi:hypothetical protein